MKNALYTALNAFTFGRGIQKHISGFTLNIPTRYHRFFNSNYELNNINFINNNLEEGMVVVDVGAHIGLLSVIISQKIGNTGKVYSFEPTPSTFSILKKTIKINKKGNTIIPINKAVSHKSGIADFYVTDIAAHNSNSLSNNHRNYGNEHKIEVGLTSIDELKTEFNIPKIHMIKIDAEGAELSVLKGSIEAIEEFRPKIILALHPSSIVNYGTTLNEIWAFVKSHHYSVYYKNVEITKDFFITQKDLFDVFLI